MDQAGKVQGIVVDREGRAVAEATIVVAEGTSPVPEIAIVPDADGHFTLQLPNGRFTLEARGEGATRGRTTIEITGPLTEARIELK